MAYGKLALALTAIAVASPVSAIRPDPETVSVAPDAPPHAKYCLRIEAITGSRLEEVKCWTRQEWADQDVDVDEEWAEEGVRVIA